MKKPFEIDKIMYVVEIDDNEVYFYICTKLSEYTIDASEIVFYGDDESEKIFKSRNSKFPITVVKKVMTILEDYIKESHPRFFRYSANEKDKFSLYLRLAEKLCKEFRYCYRVRDNEFLFNRLY